MRHPLEAAIIALTTLYLASALALFALGYAPASIYAQPPVVVQAQQIARPLALPVTVYSVPNSSVITTTGPAVNVPPSANLTLPAKLIIPALDIETKVQHVGTTSQGNMAIPSNHTDVGWYSKGTVPGQKGSAVFAGHSDSPWFSAGVFRNLENLTTGDEILTTDENGTTLTFVVTERAIYDEATAPLDYIFGRTDKARLVLITCDGTWNQSVRRYDKRMVVFAELKS